MFLYQLRDMQLAALAPWQFMAFAVEKILKTPLWPFVHQDESDELGLHLATLEQSARFYAKIPFRLARTKTRGQSVAVREQIIARTPFCDLIHFERVSFDPELSVSLSREPRILLLTPYSGHCAAVMRDTVRALLPQHNVYVTEWADAKNVPLAMGTFDLDDQIGLMAQFIRKLGCDVHVIAISQASLPALAAISLLAEAQTPCAPRTLTLIGGPIDSKRALSPLGRVALSHPLSWFQNTQIQYVPPYYPGAFRFVYPGFMRLRNRMAMISSIQLTEQKKYFAHLVQGCEESGVELADLYESFLAVTDVPSELYLQFIERAYQQAALASGSYLWRGRRVNPAAIRETALLTVEAELDNFSPPGQTAAALTLCSGLRNSMKQSHLEIGAGHYAIFTGRKWRNTIAPLIQNFIHKHAFSILEP